MPENSTVVNIENYTSSRLVRAKMEDIHGRWYMHQYEAKTWGEPTYELWAGSGKGQMAMEGYFIYTGTEGAVEYKFDDNETTIRIWFSNPLVGSNSYDAKTWGPKSGKYRWEWEGEGNGNYARRTIKIFDQ